MEAARPQDEGAAPETAAAETAAPETKERRAGRSGAHSGRLLLRMPESLHAELARASQSDGVSLNTFITEVLANAVGWQGSGLPARGKRRRPARAASAEARRPMLPSLLVANLVIVGAVGIVALVLLFQTLL
jgi:hypothetical protein